MSDCAGLPFLHETAPNILAMPMEFFRFPSEIRNKIYEVLLVAPGAITIELVPGSSILYMVRGSVPLYPAIIAADKSTRHEASPVILYARNTFTFGIDIPRLQMKAQVPATKGSQQAQCNSRS